MPVRAPAVGAGLDARTARLLGAPVLPTLVRMAAPNVLVMLAQASVGLIETYFVARLGTDALAGLSLVFPVFMLLQMVSGGAMGGGITTAVARALGRGDPVQAGSVAWYAVLVALAFGLMTSLLALGAGPALYRLLGGHGASHQIALDYSNIVFGGALLIWLFNSLSAVIRGTGDMLLPTVVIVAGALVLVPLSYALIFGWGPLPRLGPAGGALAVLLYYGAGSVVFAWHLWRGKGVLRPARRPPPLRWAPLREILRIGALSSVVSVSANLTIAGVTYFVASHGTAAVAGYGAGSRLEYMLVPLTFGLGVPISVLVATSIGAGDKARALRVAWTGAALACVMCETIGIAAALWPHAWVHAFGSDPLLVATGVAYLRIAGPFYGLFGLGLGLYFAAQGSGRLWLPVSGAVLRMAAALGGCWAAAHYGLGIDWLFWSVGAGMAVLAAINGAATLARIGYR